MLFVSEVLYLPVAWPQLGVFHQIAASIAIILPYIFLYLSAAGDPGTIEPGNHADSMALYPYDFTLFHPGNECHTCRLLKPARSKHCSICKRCISKSDHHCIFINNCVGSNNQRWFVLLLLTTGILTAYGAALGMGIMIAKMRTRYPYWALWPRHANDGAGMEIKEYLIIWSWGLQGNAAMGSVTLLALLTSPLVWGLLIYQVWLIYCGTTTNETLKWSDLQADMDDGFTFRRKMPLDRARDPRIEPAWTRWPAEPEQVLVRAEDGKPPPADATVPGVGDWEPVWKLRDVENLYDLGFWDNLIDVFLPAHTFREKDIPRSEGGGSRPRRSARG